MENKIEHEMFTATIRTAYPKGSIQVALLRTMDLAQHLEFAYGNSECEWRKTDAPKDPCPDHLYWEKNSCPRCLSKQLISSGIETEESIEDEGFWGRACSRLSTKNILNEKIIELMTLDLAKGIGHLYPKHQCTVEERQKAHLKYYTDEALEQINS